MKYLIIILFCVTNFSLYGQNTIRITSGMNLQAAIDEAEAGTAFLVESGSYGALTINKRVALIGGGYFQSSSGTASCLSVKFNSGSDNSYISGFSIAEDISVAANDITIQRNHIGRSIIADYSTSGISGTIIKQNFINQSISLRSSLSRTAIATNTLIKNNIILGTINYVSNSFSGEAINNTILCYNSCGQEGNSNWSMSFVNNIIASTCNYSTSSYPNGRYSTNATFMNNLIKTTHFITSDASNKKVLNFDNVFVGYPSNTAGATLDGRFALSANSPGKGMGIGGTEAGAFGGNEPYVLQGIPIGPNILNVIAPTGAAAGQIISVQIQAKTQN